MKVIFSSVDRHLQVVRDVMVAADLGKLAKLSRQANLLEVVE